MLPRAPATRGARCGSSAREGGTAPELRTHRPASSPVWVDDHCGLRRPVDATEARRLVARSPVGATIRACSTPVSPTVPISQRAERVVGYLYIDARTHHMGRDVRALRLVRTAETRSDQAHIVRWLVREGVVVGAE